MAVVPLKEYLRNERIRKLFPAIFYMLLGIFLVLYLRSMDWGKLHGIHIGWAFLAIASLSGLTARYWSIFIWFVLLKGLGAKDLAKSYRQLIYVYAKSWMGRYIPGTAPWILGKIYFASRHGIAKEKLAVSSLLEGALQIITLLVLSLAMLLLDTRFGAIGKETRLFMGIVAVAGIVMMMPPVFNRFVSLAHRILKRSALHADHLANGPTIGKGALLFTVGAIINGISFFFITKSVYPQLQYGDLLFVMGASNLAGALGMLAIFAPSGIGVREGVQLVLLTAIMPKEIALVVVVVSRIWSVAMDFIFFGFSWAIKRPSDNALFSYQTKRRL